MSAMMEADPVRKEAMRELERLSEAEIEARILELKDQIALAELELERKRAHRQAADALFRKS